MESERSQATKNRIGSIALVIVLFHMILGLYVAFVPDQFLSSNKLTNAYRRLVVLGPFFTDSRIKQSQFLSVRYLQHHTWSTFRVFGKEHFASYYRRPWQYSNLAYIGYERQLAHSVATEAKSKPFESVRKSVVFRELNEFLVEELIKKQVDSIQLVCGWDYYDPSAKSYLPDTLFVYTYNPNDIGKVKK